MYDFKKVKINNVFWIYVSISLFYIAPCSSFKTKNNVIQFYTVKPLIMNTSEEFMSFILYYVNFSICEKK